MTSSDETETSTEPDAEASDDVAEDGVDEDTPVATITLISILVVIGVVWAVSASLTGSSAQPYNGFEFTRSDVGYWQTTVQGAQGPTLLEFRRHPSDVDNISVSPDATRVVRAVQERNGSVRLTVDEPYAQGGRVGIAVYEISKITNYMFGIDTQGGVANASLSDKYPVVTCDNVTSTQAVIRIQAGEATRITERNGCVTITAASPSDVIRASDRFVYGLLGII